jgi:hypothetical protein
VIREPDMAWLEEDWEDEGWYNEELWEDVGLDAGQGNVMVSIGSWKYEKKWEVKVYKRVANVTPEV